MMYKKGDCADHENYRPIALINTLVKVFTQILYQRLTRWTHSNRILPEFQNGFRGGGEVVSIIFSRLTH